GLHPKGMGDKSLGKLNPTSLVAPTHMDNDSRLISGRDRKLFRWRITELEALALTARLRSSGLLHVCGVGPDPVEHLYGTRSETIGHGTMKDDTPGPGHWSVQSRRWCSLAADATGPSGEPDSKL